MYALELVGEADAFACYEAAALISGVRRLAPGLALSPTAPSTLDRLAYTRYVTDVVAVTGPTMTETESALVAAEIDRRGTAAVRARSIRGTSMDTQEIERRLGRILVDRGFDIDLEDPMHELRVIFAGEIAVLGWLVVEPGDDFAGRRPTDRPFFQPGGMSPRLARSLVNIAGVSPGDRLLDPMCGTGGVLIEAGRMGITPIGGDTQVRMVMGTRENLAMFVDTHEGGVFRGDATSLPVADEVIDAVVLDVPYGRQSPITGTDRDSLVIDALTEASRLAESAVIVADRSLAKEVRSAGWRLRGHFSRRVHRSLVRHIHDLRQPG